MTPEEELQQLEQRLTAHFGAETRYKNDVFEKKASATADKIAIATAVLRDPDRGVAGHIYESQRKLRLGLSD